MGYFKVFSITFFPLPMCINSKIKIFEHPLWWFERKSPPKEMALFGGLSLLEEM